MYSYYSEKIVNKPYEIDERRKDKALQSFKPAGFWISVDGEDDWYSWCKKESHWLVNLKYRHEVILKEGANILYIKTPDQLKEFTKKYEAEFVKHFKCINWFEVYKDYQGIIIAPYQWECRLDPPTFWYYGWDCASGCIWDLNIIEKIEFAEEMNTEIE